jgi:glutaredoxin
MVSFFETNIYKEFQIRKINMERKKSTKKEIIPTILILTIILISLVSFVNAQENSSSTTTLVEEIDFFWMNGCSACAQMKPYLEEISSQYNITLNSYETSKNRELFTEKLEEYEVPKNKRGYVPTVFIKDKYFVGYSSEITNAIESIILGEEIDNSENLVGEVVRTKVLGIWDVEVSLDEKSLFTAGFILALLDSINVCSITVLIFLIIYSLSIGSIKKTFKIGIIFTIVIFLFYSLFMLFLTNILGVFVNDYNFQIRMGIILISFFGGMILIKDFFWYGKGISLSIPKSAKPLLEKYIKQATIGSTIILGVLASLVELPCTAIFPLIYTTMLAESGILGFKKISYILFYNLIYIWPLLFLTFSTYFSWTKIENVDEKIQDYKGLMKLIAGIALIIISIYFTLPLIR